MHTELRPALIGLQPQAHKKTSTTDANLPRAIIGKYVIHKQSQYIHREYLHYDLDYDDINLHSRCIYCDCL